MNSDNNRHDDRPDEIKRHDGTEHDGTEKDIRDRITEESEPAREVRVGEVGRRHPIVAPGTETPGDDDTTDERDADRERRNDHVINSNDQR